MEIHMEGVIFLVVFLIVGLAALFSLQMQINELYRDLRNCSQKIRKYELDVFFKEKEGCANEPPKNC